MKVFLICRPCDDSYYSGHPTDKAFFKKEDADDYLSALNGSSEDLDYEYQYYIHEIEVK